LVSPEAQMRRQNTRLRMCKKRLRIETIVSMPFEENTYVVHREDHVDCVVIDPGLEPQKIIGILEQQGLTPRAIICTHGHADHIGGNGVLKQRWPEVVLAIGHGDAEKLTDPQRNLSAGFGLSVTSPPADILLRHGETYEAAGIPFEILETPGHSAGHVVLVVRIETVPTLFGGDVLFRGSIGRTDFPDGNHQQLIESIRGELFLFPDESVVLSGHGPPTTVGREKRENPFVGIPAGYAG
ncbi:MAG: MBL fold metallo-hydrolase, partial [Pirellulales bacterium]